MGSCTHSTLTTRSSPTRVRSVPWNTGCEASPGPTGALPRLGDATPDVDLQGPLLQWFARVAYTMPLGLHQRLLTAMLQPAGRSTGRPVHRDKEAGCDSATQACHLFLLLRTFPGVFLCSRSSNPKLFPTEQSAPRIDLLGLLGLLFSSESDPYEGYPGASRGSGAS